MSVAPAYPTEEEIRAALLDRVAKFCDLTGCSITAVGQQAVNDTAFIHDIKNGKNFTVARFQRAMDWLDENWPQTEAAQ